MWTTIHVATSAEEARIITELLDSHNITYELEAGPVSGTVEILVQEGDLQAAKALFKDEPSPTTGPLQAPPPELLCLRCSVPLRRIGFWATGFMDVEVYSCPRCGCIELFQPMTQHEHIVQQDEFQEEPLPEIATPASEDAYDALCRKASQLIDQGQLQQAIEVYEQVAAEFANTPGALDEAQRCIAILQERLAKERAKGGAGEPKPQPPVEQESLALGSRERYEALQHEAARLSSSGQWQAAIAVYQQIIREFPYDLKAWEEADRHIRNLEERLKQ